MTPLPAMWNASWRETLQVFLSTVFLSGLFAVETIAAESANVEEPSKPVQVCVKLVDGKSVYYRIKREDYVVQAGDTLSDLLFDHGLTGQREFAMYSHDNWLHRVMALNPKIKSWSELQPGTSIVIEYPEAIGPVAKLSSQSRGCVDVDQAQISSMSGAVQREQDEIARANKEAEDRRLAAEAEVAAQRAAEEQRQRDLIEHAKENKIEDIATLPKESIEQIPKDVLSEKLTDEKVAELPPETIEKIPEAVVEEKAQQTSFFDSLKPGMSNLFNRISEQTAGGYIGARYGASVARSADSPLVSKQRIFGLLAELRKGALSGTRLYWDKALESTADVDGETQSLRWQKFSLGYAFEIPVSHFVDYVHVTPKIGRYTLDANLPVGTTLSGKPAMHQFSIGKGLATGGELDVEKASLFYAARGWVAADFSGIGIKTDERVTSTRMGLDFFLKGGGFSLGGAQLSPAYLAFVSAESLSLRGTDADVGDYVININIPVAGLGLGLQW